MKNSLIYMANAVWRTILALAFIVKYAYWKTSKSGTIKTLAREEIKSEWQNVHYWIKSFWYWARTLAHYAIKTRHPGNLLP